MKWSIQTTLQAIGFEFAADKSPEYQFAKPRRWRFDFAWLELKVAWEIEGGTWTGNGRHTSGVGYKKDCQKYNAAAILGWMVIRTTTDMVASGEALESLRQALGARSSAGKGAA